MYEQFFSFSASPFRLNPDPKFFFGSKSHNKAMAYLHYGLRQAEGFIVITGEIGAGKSMLIGHLLDQLDRSSVVAAHLLTTSLDPSALLSHILSSFRVEPAGEGKSAEIEAFEDFLFDQMNRGRRVLLIVDEAQNLPLETIEELRMLSNMDYDGTPLFQVFLVGQPEFRSLLSRPDMEQFRQRVIASYHLEPLGPEETAEYVRHRLSLVGWRDDPAIDEAAFAAIHEATGGVPRKINKLGNRLLLHCSIEGLHAVDAATAAAVIKDLKDENLERPEDGATDDKPAGRSQADKAALAKTVRGAKAGGERAPAGKKSGPVVIPFEAVRKIAPEPDAGAPADKERRSAMQGDEPAPRASAEEAAPRAALSATGVGTESVLDRLRASSARRREEAARTAPAAATLTDVAKAIAAVSTTEDRADENRNAALDDDDEALQIAGLAGESNDWRDNLVRSIDDVSDELKVAHKGVSRLRRRLSESRPARKARREKLSAALSRAEAILADIRSAER